MMSMIRYLLFWRRRIPTSLLSDLHDIWEAGQHRGFDRSARWRWWWVAQALTSCVWLRCILPFDWRRCCWGPRHHSEGLGLRQRVWMRIFFLILYHYDVLKHPVCLFLRSFSVLSFSFQLCCCCRCGTRAAGGSFTWVEGSHNVWPRNRGAW